MYAKIKELADEAIALQNKDRMDAVLREISELCAYEGIADARKKHVVAFVERTAAAAIKNIEDLNPLADGKAVDYNAPAENPIVLDGDLNQTSGELLRKLERPGAGAATKKAAKK